MLTTERIKTISRLALPFTIALSSQFLLALIDLAMVGRLGNTAVAAVGVSGFCYSLVVAFIAGISPAVQGIVARRRGERSPEPRCLPLNAGLVAAVVVGGPLAVLCHFATPRLFSLIASDAKVAEAGVQYLSILYFGIVAVGLNGAFKGFWAGMERARVQMSVVLFTCVINVLFNYALIYGNWGMPAMGIRGAALGTVLALYTAVIVHAAVAWLQNRKDGFLSVKPTQAIFTRILKIGMPAGMQEFFFSAGYIIFFWMVGQVGTQELAAANVLIRITMVMVFLAMALGMASATLVSRTVGEGDIPGAVQWGWDVGKLGVISITLMGLPMLVFPEWFLSFFLRDPNTAAISVIPLQMVAVTTGIGSLIYILGYTLYSLGDGNRVVLVSFSTQWLFFLPLVYIVGPYLRSGLLEIWLVQMAYGTLATALIVAIWVNGRWKRLKI